LTPGEAFSSGAPLYVCVKQSRSDAPEETTT
jgi:hypothetical protein